MAATKPPAKGKAPSKPNGRAKCSGCGMPLTAAGKCPGCGNAPGKCTCGKGGK